MNHPPTPTPAFTAPTTAPAPVWALDVDPWAWDAVEGVWTRWVSRRVGGDITAVVLGAVQNAHADGAVQTSVVDLRLPSHVQPEEAMVLSEVLREAAELLGRSGAGA